MAIALAGLAVAALVGGAVYFLVVRDGGSEIEVAIGGSAITATTATTTTAAPQTLPSVGLSTSTLSAALPPGSPMDFAGGDAALDALANACFAGDMESCDDLYRQADAGSPYERYGDTCAGRQAPGTGRFCASVFPSVTSVASSAPTSTSMSTTTTPG